MITVGRMAERYGLLPSEVAARATTYDIMITDVLASYTQYEQQKSNNQLVDPDSYGLSTEEMMMMMEKANGK